jgi:hypothetical protein
MTNRAAFALLAVTLLSLPAAADEVHVDLPPGETEASIVHREPLLPPASWRRFNAGKTERASYELAVNPDGKVAQIRALEAPADRALAKHFADVLSQWRFAPKQAERYVVHVTVTPRGSEPDIRDESLFPPMRSPFPRTRQELISPNDRLPPDDIKQRNAGKHLPGTYVVYVDLDGAVVHVGVKKSIPGVDEAMIERFEDMRFNGLARRGRFELPVDAVFASAPVSQPHDAPPRYKAVPPDYLRDAALSTPPIGFAKLPVGDVQVRGAYLVYVDTDGHVPRVDVVASIPEVDDQVVAKLKEWTFKPQVEPVKFMKTIFLKLKR